MRNLLEIPRGYFRYFGSPQRRIVRTPEELEYCIEKSEISNQPSFLSLAYYRDKELPIMGLILFDFDSPNLSLAYEEFQRLKLFLEKRGLPFYAQFSGKKGFHLIQFIRPGIHDKRELKSYQLGIKLTLNLETLDSHIFGDRNRLFRIPNTRNNGRYCIPIRGDESLDEILRLSKKPRDWDYSIPEYVPSLQQLEPKIQFKRNYEKRISIFKKDFSRIFIERPCLLSQSLNDNPDHWIRFALVSYLFSQGFDEAEIFELISKFNWRDFDPDITRYQIEHICSLPYSPPNCSTIKSKGYCLGRKCENYED